MDCQLFSTNRLIRGGNPALTGVAVRGYAVEAEGLGKLYPNGVWGARDVNLTARYGEVVVLLGPNGAGKTTTVGMLTTLLKPSKGWARVAGYDVVRDYVEVRKRVALCPQDISIDANWTPLEAVTGYLMIRGFSRGEAVNEAKYWLDVLDLWGVRRRLVRALSGGQRKRVAVAMVLASNASVLFLDEPTAGLDVGGRYRVWRALREFVRGGKCVVMTTHDMREAQLVADQVVMIHKGVTVASGTPEELMRALPYRFKVIIKGRVDGLSASKVLRLGDRVVAYARDREEALRIAGSVTASDVVIGEVDLEDAYLEVIGGGG